MFAFLGFDDRFLFHERVSRRIGVDDHFILLATAAVEIGLLYYLGRAIWTSQARRWLFVAAALFAVMIAFDACLPRKMVLRLTLEDLAKTWSTLFFFLFAWEICLSTIRDRKRVAQ